MLHGEIDILPFPEGKILVGATHENTQGFDLFQMKSSLNGMYEEACASLQSKNAKRSGCASERVRIHPIFYRSLAKFQTRQMPLWRSGLGSSGLHKWRLIGECHWRMAAGEEVGFSVEKYTRKIM